MKALVLAVVMSLISCGGVEERTPYIPPEAGTPERSWNYPSPQVGGGPICGWLTFPNGKTDFVPCPEKTFRSPASDPPENDEPAPEVPPGMDPRPDPPGDPTPF